MKYIKIMFTSRKSNNLLSWLIKKVLKTKYSHVILNIQLTELDRNIYYEAGIFGVKSLNDEELNNHNIVHSKALQLNDDKCIELRQYCIDNLHKAYGWLTLVGLYCKLIFGMRNSIGKDGSRSFICSEFIAKALKMISIDFKANYNIDLDTLTPKELYALVRGL